MYCCKRLWKYHIKKYSFPPKWSPKKSKWIYNRCVVIKTSGVLWINVKRENSDTHIVCDDEQVSVKLLHFSFHSQKQEAAVAAHRFVHHLQNEMNCHVSLKPEDTKTRTWGPTQNPEGRQVSEALSEEEPSRWSEDAEPFIPCFSAVGLFDRINQKKCSVNPILRENWLIEASNLQQQFGGLYVGKLYFERQRHIQTVLFLYLFTDEVII